MTKWRSAAVVLTMSLCTACSSEPKTPIVTTDALPQKSMSATNQIAPSTPEPLETAPPIDDSVEEGGIVGSVAGGVPGGVVGGVPGGVIGVNTNTDLPDGVLRVSDPRLGQAKCTNPGAPEYPKAARDAQVETIITARCIVETNGSLTCTLVRSHPMFEKPLMDHLNKSKVPPMMTTDGKPARVQCYFRYRFKLS